MSQIPKRRHAPKNLSLSPAMEDYLKAIFKLTKEKQSVSTQSLADKLEVSPASTTKMIKRLAESGLVVHEPYQGVVLTETGRKIAVEIVRHHRLLELYLTKALGFTWDEVHEEAELLEHYISEKLEAKICAFLGNPSFDPHGSPIPTLEGEIPKGVQIALGSVELGDLYEIAQVHTQESEILRELEALGLVPGVTVTVFGRPPQGKVHAKVGRKEHLISPELCHHLSCRSTNEDCFPANELQLGETGRVTKLRGTFPEALGLEIGSKIEMSPKGLRFAKQSLSSNLGSLALVTLK